MGHGIVNKPKRAGTAWESAVCRYLNERGLKVVRRALTGGKDQGDIYGLDNWTLECKAERSIDLAGALNEAKQEAANAGTDFYAAVHKRRNHSTEDGYVTVPLSMFVDLVLERAS